MNLGELYEHRPYKRFEWVWRLFKRKSFYELMADEYIKRKGNEATPEFKREAYRKAHFLEWKHKHYPWL